ncbi:MAG TPA: ATP-binding protein [Micromonosporaceae bacterium]|nr:ATP-binding protein [Micromonosporaceae bacterium]
MSRGFGGRIPSDGYPQQVTGSLVDISAEVSATPFFANQAAPLGRVEQALRAQLDPGLAPFLDDLDEGLDARHFVERGAGLNALADPLGSSGLVGCFTGRKEQLRRLAPWLNGEEGGRLTVVTGSPGVGKSALLGVLVCAGHPTLREHTRPVWQRVAQAPYLVRRPFAAVHARQRDLAAILASLTRQLALDEVATAADLTHALCGLPEVPVVVLDALDEADDGVMVMNELLLPLAAAHRADGEPAMRLLVGTRRYDEYLPLLRVASTEQGLVDLDDVPRQVLEDDLERYVHELLGVTRYRDYGAVRGAFAAKVARVLADPGTEPTAGRWESFSSPGFTRATWSYHTWTDSVSPTPNASAGKRRAPCPMSWSSTFQRGPMKA